MPTDRARPAGAGDVLASVLGLYIVAIALRRRVSPVVIARMLLNLGLRCTCVTLAALSGGVEVLGLRAVVPPRRT